RPALGGDDQIVVAAHPVDQRQLARLSRLAARGRQQERLRALPIVAFLATGFAIALRVFFSEEHVSGFTPLRSRDVRATRSRAPAAAAAEPLKGPDPSARHLSLKGVRPLACDISGV